MIGSSVPKTPESIGDDSRVLEPWQKEGHRFLLASLTRMTRRSFASQVSARAVWMIGARQLVTPFRLPRFSLLPHSFPWSDGATGAPNQGAKAEPA